MTLDEANFRNPFDSVDEDEAKFLLSGISQQTGLALVDKNNDPVVDEFADNLACNRGRGSGELVPIRHLPIGLRVDGELQSLIGMSSLISSLKEHILDLREINDASLKRYNMYLDVDSISLDKKDTQSFLDNKKTILNKYIKIRIRIRLLRQAINELIDEEKGDKERYLEIKDRLDNWAFIIDEVFPNLADGDRVASLFFDELLSQFNDGQEVLRIKNLLTGERIGRESSIQKVKNEAVEVIFDKVDPNVRLVELKNFLLGKEALRRKKLKERVIGVLLGTTSYQQKDVLLKDLSTELLATATVINDIRIVDVLKKENIDLLVLRDRVRQITEEYKKDPSKSEKLNQEIIEEIVIPIANKVKELFPHHFENDSPSFIAAALYHREAVCSGKSEILTSIFKLLKLKAKVVNVELTLSDETNHAISSLDLFNNVKLLIDANFNSFHGCSENDLKNSKNSKESVAKILANEKKIDPSSNVLIYLATKITKEEFDSLLNYKFILFKSGRTSFYYKTNIPYPHKLVSIGKESYISSSAYYNYADFFSDEKHRDEEEELYRKALEINPDNSSAFCNYASLLRKRGRFNDARKLYRKALEINPNDLWIRTNYAFFLEDFPDSLDESNSQYKMVLELSKKYPEQKNWLSTRQIEGRIRKLSSNTDDDLNA